MLMSVFDRAKSMSQFQFLVSADLGITRWNHYKVPEKANDGDVFLVFIPVLSLDFNA